MKTYYTISEIGKLLGLTTDAIRFYEKKGLVHPKLHPHNHYRMYHLDNVLELLDIIYYRHLDIPMKDICEMASSLNPTHVLSLLEPDRSCGRDQGAEKSGDGSLEDHPAGRGQ